MNIVVVGSKETKLTTKPISITLYVVVNIAFTYFRPIIMIVGTEYSYA